MEPEGGGEGPASSSALLKRGCDMQVLEASGLKLCLTYHSRDLKGLGFRI